MIRVNNIVKSYRKKEVLTGVSFHVKKGECIGIVGPNGCGKSTLLGILSGANKADLGEILYNNENLIHSQKLFSKYVGYVPQENPLMDKLTVLDNLRFWYCDSERNLNEDLISGIPAMFGLNAYAKYSVEKLSGGMKKRLSIACSIAKNPPILILDEPGASLDIVCKQDIKNYLTMYKKNGGTIIIASHEDGELSLCDRMYLMQNGILSELPKNTFGNALMERMIASHV